MNDIDLTPKLKEKMESYPRTRGRYNSSEIYALFAGWTTPETWMNSLPKKPKDLLNMWNGVGMHNQLEELMGKEHSEKKVVYEYKGIKLVGKADFLPQHKDEVWEFKTSAKKMDKAKPWAAHQVRLYTTMFEKPKGVIYQPIQSEQGLFLKNLGSFDRNDKWFEGEMEKLYKFHLLVEQLWEEKNKEVEKI